MWHIVVTQPYIHLLVILFIIVNLLLVICALSVVVPLPLNIFQTCLIIEDYCLLICDFELLMTFSR